MAENAHDPSLKRAFKSHLDETKTHKDNLIKICDMLDIKPSGHTCKAMEGLIEEGKILMDVEGSPEAKDAGLIAAAQKVEHYEIAGYGTARYFAEMLGKHQIAQILSENEEQEKAADQKLNELAKQSINQRAMVSDGQMRRG